MVGSWRDWLDSKWTQRSYSQSVHNGKYPQCFHITGEGLSMSWLVILTCTWQNSWTFSHRASIERRHAVISSTTRGLKWIGGKTPEEGWRGESAAKEKIVMASKVITLNLSAWHPTFALIVCAEATAIFYSDAAPPVAIRPIQRNAKPEGWSRMACRGF